MPVNTPITTACFLYDNGSLRADSTLSLRRLAKALTERVGQPIDAVSLLHSSNVPADELNGEPARLLEPALVAFFEKNPAGEATLLPLFFGPSAAVIEYVPARLASIKVRYPHAQIRTTAWLVNAADGDHRIASILADQIRETARARGWLKPKVVLVDHGSPQRAVAEVRNYLGNLVRAELGDEIEALMVASMERREGDAYAFNEPLLETALRTPPFDHGNVIIALQFLSPGRHAGKGGDIAKICDDAGERAHSTANQQSGATADNRALHTQMTQPIAGDPRLVDVLADRLGQARAV